MTIADETFNEIYGLIESRLNVLGPVRTVEAWQICKGNTPHSYETVAIIMRHCLNTMVEQRKAVKLNAHVWEIRKANDPLINKEPEYNFDDDDANEEPAYYNCLGCGWSGVVNPGLNCPRCAGASIDGVY